MICKATEEALRMFQYFNFNDYFLANIAAIIFVAFGTYADNVNNSNYKPSIVDNVIFPIGITHIVILGFFIFQLYKNLS